MHYPVPSLNRRDLARLLVLPLLGAAVACASPWRSGLYPEDWVPPQYRTDIDFIEDRFVQDFSFAGYHRGERPVPHITGPVFNALDHGADPTGTDDSTAAIQAAIDAAESAGGGVVYLPEGEYRVSKPADSNHALRIRRSDMVLRGAGPDKTFIVNTTTDMRSSSVIRVEPEGGGTWATPASTPTAVTQDHHGPTTSVTVASTRLLNPGDWIVVHNPFTDTVREEGSFVQDVGLDGTRTGPNWVGQGDSLGGPMYLRQIKAVDPDTGTLDFDAPTRWRLLTRDNARVYRASSMLEEVGLEGFSIGNIRHPATTVLGNDDYRIADRPAYEVHSSYLVNVQRVRNGWVRSVHSFDPGNNNGIHMLSNGFVIDWSRGVTLDDVRMERTQYGGGGGNGYMIRLNSVNEILVRNSHVGHCRHGFVMWRMQNSGNVFHNCTDEFTGVQLGDNGQMQFVGGRGSDHHGLFSHSNLADNHRLRRSFLEAAFRGTSGTVHHAQTSSQTVFWNARGEEYFSGRTSVVHSQQFGHGYIIGTRGPAPGVETGPLRAGSHVFTDPVDWTEGVGEGDDLEPRSLYLDQYLKRLRREGKATPPWHGAARLDDNYFELEGVGLFHQVAEASYIYMAAYGWLYVHGMDPDNIFLHDPAGRWLWTARHILPHAWDYADEVWTSVLPGTAAP